MLATLLNRSRRSNYLSINCVRTNCPTLCPALLYSFHMLPNMLIKPLRLSHTTGHSVGPLVYCLIDFGLKNPANLGFVFLSVGQNGQIYLYFNKSNRGAVIIYWWGLVESRKSHTLKVSPLDSRAVRFPPPLKSCALKFHQSWCINDVYILQGMMLANGHCTMSHT